MQSRPRLVILGQPGYARPGFGRGLAGIWPESFVAGLEMETLQSLREYFPTAVFTGQCLLFISEDWRVELTEHKNTDFTNSGEAPPTIRVRIARKALNGEFVHGHYEDFRLAALGELAGEVEKYVQSAIGANLRESI